VRSISQQKRFRDDLRRRKRRGKRIEELFEAVQILAEEGELPSFYSPHRLTGEWGGFWECHIEPDWLLIYLVTDAEVFLLRTGSHADLFD